MLLNTKKQSFKPLALAISLALGINPQWVQATTFTVTNTSNAGAGSLRREILSANQNEGLDTIEFLPALVGATIAIPTEIVIDDGLIIKGPVDKNPKSITLDAQSNSRHFNASSLINGDTLTLENINLVSGKDTSNVGGGALLVQNADTTLNHVTISQSSSASFGGAVKALSGTLTLNNSVIYNNSSEIKGGGLYLKTGSITLNQSTISNNSVTGSLTGNNVFGGGIFLSTGNITLNSSSIERNKAIGYHNDGLYYGAAASSANGGGLYITQGNTLLNNSTISKNRVSGENGSSAYGGTFGNNGGNAIGGGIFSTGLVTLKQSTLSKNTSSPGDASYGSQASGSDGTGDGAAIYANAMDVYQSTLVNNSGTRGGAVSILSPTNSTLSNSILSKNTGTLGNFNDRSGLNILEASYSLFGDALTEISNQGGVFQYLPDLGLLQHNGGLTQTHKPNINSPAINFGSNGYIPNGTLTDQRGTSFSRIVDTTVDMGAVEFQQISGNIQIPLNINEVVTRRDMARELLKAKLGNSVNLNPATGNLFTDIDVGDINAEWIEKLRVDGYVAGCDTNKFCPNAVVTREEMAKIFLKVKNGAAFAATSVNNHYIDVPLNAFNAVWINELGDNPAFTTGCDTNKFCPKEHVTRKWFDTLLAQLPP